MAMTEPTSGPTPAPAPARCEPGDWVEIELVLLEPAERASNLPPETAEEPLVMWVNGFAKSAAGLGEEVTVATMTGRAVTGRLACARPGYYHTFGEHIAELAHVGPDLRARIAAYRKAGAR